MPVALAQAHPWVVVVVVVVVAVVVVVRPAKQAATQTAQR
jgi:hypothetical protein